METTSRREEAREHARKLIDRLRVENGDITEEDREFLRTSKPVILKSLDSARRKLGADTQTYVSALKRALQW
jgi:polyhydroxyalkanoate synthesis regulator phasin